MDPVKTREPGEMTGIPAWNRLSDLLDSFQGIRILVLGDLVLDEFLFGEIRRVSREAPVLILDHTETACHPGGGANAIQNLFNLGAKVIPVGIVGNDPSGRELLKILRSWEIDTAEIMVGPQWQTPTKTRILAGLPQSSKQQVLRVDRGDRGGVPEGASAQILSSLRRRVGEVQGMLISDYGYGSIPAGEISAILGVAKRSGLRVTVDSRNQLAAFHGITAATPNLEEAEKILEFRIGDDEQRLAEAGRNLLDRVETEALLITLGSRGMGLFLKNQTGMERIPASGPRNPVDVTGAGDTVISVFTLGILAGGSFLEAAHLANIAAGISVMKLGTEPVSTIEIRQKIQAGKKEDR